MSWCMPSAARRQLTAEGRYGMPDEWRPNEPFRATLTLIGVKGGQSAARFLWYCAATAAHYPMLPTDACQLMLNPGGVRNGTVTGEWIVVKRGQAYGIAQWPTTGNRPHRDDVADVDWPRPDQPADFDAVAPDPVSPFDFGRAIRDPAVRAEIARRGYVNGRTVAVGRDTPAYHAHFRVWRDDTVPGGWTGEPVVLVGVGSHPFRVGNGRRCTGVLGYGPSEPRYGEVCGQPPEASIHKISEPREE